MPTIISIASLETYSNTHSEHKIKPPNPDSNSNSKSNSNSGSGQGQQHDSDSSSHNNNSSSSSSSSSLIINPNSNSNSAAAAAAAAAEASAAASAPPPIYLMRSPSLYTTPSPHQLQPQPQLGHHAATVWESSPPTPSPYLTNSKRRGGGGSANANAILRLPPPSLHQMNQNQNQNQTDEVIIDDYQGQGDGDGDPLLLAIAKAVAAAAVYDDDDAYDLEEDDDFFESRDSMSIASSSASDAEDRPTLPRQRSRHRHRRYPFRSAHQSSSISTQSLTQSDYYDAADDFFSDGSVSNSSPSLSTNINKELKALRLSLIEESGRRKKAEEDLLCIHMQWERISAYLSQVGFSFPEIHHSGNEQLDLDPAEICQLIIVTRFVSEAIERALARAETEVITEAIIDSKNHEISRLRDRLQYYEAMNREMSQRNQEAVELTRRQRLKRKTKWRLIWGCVGLSVTFGASILAYSYLPNSGKHSLPTFSPDASAPSASNFCRN